MTSFADSAAALLDRSGRAPDRVALWNEFLAVGLPTVDDEVWRYAPLSSFDLDAYDATEHSTEWPEEFDVAALTTDAAAVVRVRDGELVSATNSLPGLVVTTVPPGQCVDHALFSERYGADAFALLNGALAPSTVVVTVEHGVQIPGPVVVIHQVRASVALPSTRVVLGAGSSLEIVECYFGGANALVAPISEYQLSDNSQLRLATYQRLENTAWHVARTTGFLARDARLHQSIVGLGGQYDRSRNDAEFVGTGSSNELHTTFLGSGHQVHDFRTHQFHRQGRSTSTLLSKGAVADHSRSVYTGLIEIDKGAKRTDARQRNVNLLLAPTAHADTVPNLDIRENDVMCAHASSVGPLDELERWYLESRGVDRDTAERLLVQGFFNEMTDSMPASIARLVEADVARVLAATRVARA